MESETKYTEILRGLMDDHRDVITLLAEGFKETRKHIQVCFTTLFMIYHCNVKKIKLRT